MFCVLFSESANPPTVIRALSRTRSSREAQIDVHNAFIGSLIDAGKFWELSQALNVSFVLEEGGESMQTRVPV